MSGRPRRPVASRVAAVRIRPRWLTTVSVVLLWACGGGSSGSGDPPDAPPTVPPPDPPPPVATSITVSPASARLEALGETVQLTAEVRDQNGNAMTDVMIVWSSDSPQVATVDAMGLVTAIGDGAATVTVTTGELSASATVTVELAPVATTLSVSPASADLERIGETVQFIAEVRDQHGDAMPDVAVMWSTDAPEVVSVSAVGLVTAVGAGTATVTAAFERLAVSATVTVDAMIDNASGREALVALYESTGGKNWVNSAHWLSERPLEEWHGVFPDHDGRVVEIAMFGNGLAGPVPPDIGTLTALRGLYLGSNELSGNLPPELGNLTNLETLSLGGNSFSGRIPPELGNLPNLQHLNLSDNRLSGRIPPEIGALRSLAELNLVHNDLSGPIPRELGNLPGLQRLFLSANRLSGPIPPELGAAFQLISLFLWGNGLSGPIPPELGNLTGLKELHVTDNDLSGTVPPELTGLSLTTFWWVGRRCARGGRGCGSPAADTCAWPGCA